MTACAGLLLTGGTSHRMGTDKASLRLGDDPTPLGARLGALLDAVAEGPVLEVGPGRSGLQAVADDEPGGGPLQAIAAGARALTGLGWDGATLVLACDLPLLSPLAVRFLADWPGQGAVVPVVAARRQPLCARWAASDLRAAERLAGEGQRSLRGLPASPALLTGATWPAGVTAATFADADTPADLAAAGVAAAVSSPWTAGRACR